MNIEGGMANGMFRTASVGNRGTFQSGQVIKGTVVDVPEKDGDPVTIQIGERTFKADVQTSVKKGEFSYFQVQPESTADKLILKSVPAPSTPTGDKPPALLHTAQLPDTPETREWAQSMRNLVKTPDQESVNDSLRSLFAGALGDKARATDAAMQRMLQTTLLAQGRALPITDATVKALQQVVYGPSLGQLLDQLEQQFTPANNPKVDGKVVSPQDIRTTVANSGQSSPLPQPIKEVIQSVRAAMSNPASVPLGMMTGRPSTTAQTPPLQPVSFPQGQVQQGKVNPTTAPIQSGNLLNTSSASLNPMSSTAAGSSVPTVPVVPPQQPMHLQPPTTVQQTSVQAQHANVNPMTTPGANQPQSNAPVNLGTGINTPTLSGGSNTVDEVVDPSTPSNRPLTDAGGNGHVTDQRQGNMMDSPRNGLTQRMIDGSNRATQSIPGTPLMPNLPNLSNRIVPITSNASSSPEMDATIRIPDARQIKGLFQMIGMMHEKQIHRVGQSLSDQVALTVPNIEDHKQSLKSLMMQLMASPESSDAVKEIAEQISNQITGQQLLLHNDRTNINQMTFWVPVWNEGQQDQVAVHVETQSNKRGEWDADNCRVWFDLNMKKLGLTLVDVHIVQKVVQIHIHNDQPDLQPWLDDNKSSMEQTIHELGYHLSILKQVSYPPMFPNGSTNGNDDRSKAETPINQRPNPSSAYRNKPYQGVDFRA